MKTRKLFFALMTIATVMFFNACSDETKPCDGVTCSGHGTPTEAAGICTCDCDPGFSGDDCECPTCLNGGSCVSGACACADGYEGDSCQILSRTRFVFANYGVTETCSRDSCGTNLFISTPDYASNITAGVDDDEIKIDHFGNYGSSSVVTATVVGHNITIASQTVLGIQFQGTGIMNNADDQIVINYTTTDGCDVVTCAATYTK